MTQKHIRVDASTKKLLDELAAELATSIPKVIHQALDLLSKAERQKADEERFRQTIAKLGEFAEAAFRQGEKYAQAEAMISPSYWEAVEIARRARKALLEELVISFKQRREDR